MTRCISLDLETMGNGPTAAIVSIGAVAFDPHDQPGEGVLDRFNVEVSLESAMATGGIVDGGTIEWWLQQSDAARASICQTNTTLSAALDTFKVWLHRDLDINLRGEGALEIWCDAPFDAVILTSAYRACHRRLPWHYRDVRDLRTLFAIASLSREALKERYADIGKPHIAVDDAHRQALMIQYALSVLS